MANLSTLDVARKVGIGRATLERWIAEKKVQAPKLTIFGRFRSWTAADVERIRKFKEKNYRHGRGRKAKSKR